MTANPAFAPKRRKPRCETHEYAQFLRRSLRAYRRRVEAGDIDQLGEMAEFAAYMDEMLHGAVGGCIDRGYSYTDVAMRLGITRQAAWQRFGRAKK